MMNGIKIDCSELMTHGAKVTTMDGVEIPGVMSVGIKMVPGDIVRAEIGVAVEFVDVVAHPLLDLESVVQAARVHGFRLVPLGDVE